MLKKILQTISNAISGRNRKGIRNRLILSTIISVIAIIVDTCMIYANYDNLPPRINTIYDWNNIPILAENKSVFWDYELQRIILLIICLTAGWLFYLWKRKSIISFRTFTLFSETANLVILTGVGITMVILALSMGDTSTTLINEWEVIVMLFWLIILIIEYIFDVKYLHNSSKM